MKTTMETFKAMIGKACKSVWRTGGNGPKDGKGKRSRDLEEEKPNKKPKHKNSFLVDNRDINKVFKLDLVRSSHQNNVVSIVNLLLSLFHIKAMTTPDIVKAFNVENETDVLKKQVRALKNGLRNVLKVASDKVYTIMENTPNKIEFLGSNEGIYILFVVLKFDTNKKNKIFKKEVKEHVLAQIAEQKNKMWHLKQMAVYDAREKLFYVSTRGKQMCMGDIMVEHASAAADKERKNILLRNMKNKMWPEATQLELIGVGVVGKFTKDE